MDARRTARPGLLPRRRPGQRGFLLIATYVLLSVFLVYSNAMVLRNLSQGLAMEQFRGRVQALDLAQGASEQLREDVHYFLEELLPLQVAPGTGDIMPGLAWFDSLGAVLAGQATIEKDGILFDLPLADGIRDGTRENPRTIHLPTMTNPDDYAKAWIVSIVPDPAGDPTDPLVDRLMTVRAEAKVGSATKKIEAVYRLGLGPSDVFRYAYFINNYGWFDTVAGTKVEVYGEVRANGDLEFSGNDLYVDGDLYASQNPALNNPKTALPSQGTITGDPSESHGIWPYDPYYGEYGFKDVGARPARDLLMPGQPGVGGPPTTLPEGYGWNAPPDQRKFPNQPAHTMPYMGDMTLYERVADSRHGSITFPTAGPDGVYGTGDDGQETIDGVYKGPDGIAGTDDDTAPLVIVGESQGRPIEINGPVVIPGDVIIKGVVTGRGSLYSGRNVHVVGQLSYLKPTVYPALLREQTTGALKDWNGVTGYVTDYPYYNIGRVCNDGTYIPPISPTQEAPPCP
ncbi:MAG: hypothetical protein HYZ92_01385 [Candidatus Omnitrophica bacterium]|nr:hypothetical protein [Candidatus Omnitrophota bacterium]